MHEPTPYTPRVISLLANRTFNTVRFALMNIFIIIGVMTVAYGGPLTYAGLFLSFLLVGYVDELLGDAGPAEELPPRWFMQAMLYLTLPLIVLLALVVVNVSSETGFAWLDAVSRLFGFDPIAARARTGDYHVTGAFVSLGMYSGMAGVTVAHELIHRVDRPLDLIVGRWLLAFTWDTGFAIEHVYGHHRNVATELDPATARRGEYVLVFIIRSTIGQIINAYRTERDRLKRRGVRDMIYNNRFWRGQAMSLAIAAAFVAFLGPMGFWLFLMAGAIGKVYLEIVNYIEHYGLVRIPGTRVEARHSWDSYRRVSTGMFYNLQLHANHHRLANRRYWELQQEPEGSPMLPAGYMPMIFLSFVPVVWQRFSNRLLADWDRRFASEAERDYMREKGILLGE
ncbi:MAG: hypothetical protein JWR75_553 [Devosia sp.]|nr:hypothetical protein [Devosia sp.]